MKQEATVESQIEPGAQEITAQVAPDAAVYLLLVFRILRTGASDGVNAIAFGSEEELDLAMATIQEQTWTDHRVVLVSIGLEESALTTWRDGGRLARRSVLDRITAVARDVVQSEANGRFGYRASYVPGRWIDTVVTTLLDERSRESAIVDGSGGE